MSAPLVAALGAVLFCSRERGRLATFADHSLIAKAVAGLAMFVWADNFSFLLATSPHPIMSVGTYLHTLALVMRPAARFTEES